jgi:glycosyltransferase involved in cell wall biosynthesis
MLSKKNIGILLSQSHIMGGTENFVFQLAELLSRDSALNVRLYVIRHKIGGLGQVGSINVINCKNPKKLEQLLFLFKFFRENHTTISFITRLNLKCLIISTLMGRSHHHYVCERGNFTLEDSVLTRVLKSVLYRLSKGVIFQTAEAAIAMPISSVPKHVIPNFANLNKISLLKKPPQSTSEPFRFLIVGRDDKLKNIFEGVNLIAGYCLLNADERFELTIVSKLSVERIRTFSKISVKNLEVKILEPTPDISQHYLKANCLVSTSLSEGFPNVILESICSGTPVIAYNCNFGIKELVKNGETGYLLLELNLACFSDAVNRIKADFSSGELDREIVENVRNKYSQAEIVKKWIDLIL